MITGQKQVTESSGKLAPWQYAGLMLSYWCSAECAFCYVNGGPRHTFWADAEKIVDWWRQLDSLAKRNGGTVKIHLTGGEVFGNWPLLIKILELANKAGLPPVEKIETNASWATDSALVRQRLTELKDLGVTLLTTDADMFHQQFVPIKHVKLLVETAQEILGPECIRVRWWDFYNFAVENNLDFSQMDEHEQREIQMDALLNGRERLNGRAAVLAGKLIKGHPPYTYFGENCQKGILKSKHVHIDPHGNIFPGTCCGIILGNAISEEIADVYDWLNTHGPSGPVIATLAEKGPVGLMEFATRFGFEPLSQGYISKCQLCYHLRSTLYQANQCRKWLGPVECYPVCF
ncbi:MAG: radical SAM protein [Phycisphaerae bacterium]